MSITSRQEKILHSLVKEYIDAAEPVSSNLLQKKCNLDISPATIRNELQELTELGYITQPHTSAGRVPTEKGYKFFVEILITKREAPQFISHEVHQARQKIEKELQLAQELIKSLTEISTTLSYTRLEDKNTIFEMLKIIGPSQSTYEKNIDVMRELLKELENF
jgi:heat-inducible transcriptional repressor